MGLASCQSVTEEFQRECQTWPTARPKAPLPGAGALAHLTGPTTTNQLRTAANAYQRAIDNLVQEQGAAA